MDGKKSTTTTASTTKPGPDREEDAGRNEGSEEGSVMVHDAETGVMREVGKEKRRKEEEEEEEGKGGG